MSSYVDWYVLNVKCSLHRPGVAQRVGRGIALLFHDRGTRRGWVFSSTPWPHFTPGKDPVPFLQEAGWAPGPVWTGGKTRPHRDSILDRPARSQLLYRLSYRAHYMYIYYIHIYEIPMEAASSSDIWLLFYQTTRHYISDDRITKSYPVETIAA